MPPYLQPSALQLPPFCTPITKPDPPPLHSFLMPHFTDALPIPCKHVAPPLQTNHTPLLADTLPPTQQTPCMPPIPYPPHLLRRWKCRSEQPRSILRPHRVPPPRTPHLIAEDAIGLGAARGHGWAGGGGRAPPGARGQGGPQPLCTPIRSHRLHHLRSGDRPRPEPGGGGGRRQSPLRGTLGGHWGAAQRGPVR